MLSPSKFKSLRLLSQSQIADLGKTISVRPCVESRCLSFMWCTNYPDGFWYSGTSYKNHWSPASLLCITMFVLMSLWLLQSPYVGHAAGFSWMKKFFSKWCWLLKWVPYYTILPYYHILSRSHPKPHDSIPPETPSRTNPAANNRFLGWIILGIPKE